MAYTRVYAQRISWENEPSINTPLNDVNLNKMDYALNQIDGTLATWDTTKANQSDLLSCVKTITYDTDTGVFVFTWQNGTSQTVDLNIEKIPVSFSMDANGVITMTTEDGTQYTADVGSLIKTYTFTDSGRIDFSVTTDASGNKTVVADIIDGSITGAKLQPNYLADCQAAQTGAETAQGLSEDSAEDAEAWANGTRGGVPVPSTDPTYENNAKYWAQQANPTVLANMSDVNLTTPTNGQVLEYNGTTQKWENKAQAGGALSNLTDVTLTNPANGNVLKYNSTSQKWENYTLTKSDIGLGNVDNTSDINKPVSTATNTLVNNKHKVTSKQVTTSGWTSDTTSQSGTTLYKKTIALSHVYVTSPTVDIGASGVLPTTAQQEAYDLLQYVTINGTTLTLYASDIPTTAFYINVEGAD